MVCLLLAAVTCVLSACDNSAGDAPIAGDPIHGTVEQSLDEQIAAVQAGDATTIRVTQVSITDDDLQRIAGLDGLTRLVAVNADATAAGVSKLTGLTALENVRIGGRNIDDNALAELAKLPALRFLIIEDAPITDSGLKHLHGLDGLESLYLNGTRVTENGLSSLKSALPTLHLHVK